MSTKMEARMGPASQPTTYVKAVYIWYPNQEIATQYKITQYQTHKRECNCKQLYSSCILVLYSMLQYQESNGFLDRVKMYCNILILPALSQHLQFFTTIYLVPTYISKQYICLPILDLILNKLFLQVFFLEEVQLVQILLL